MQRPTRQNAEQARRFITGFSVYKLITDIILAIGLIFFFNVFLKLCFARISKSPVRSGVYGFAFLILMPLASMFLLILLWLGVVSFLFFLSILIVAVYVTKVVLGWLILKWWHRRDKKVYALDWKAGVVGPIVLAIIAFVPVIGWLIDAVLFLISLGAMLLELTTIAARQRLVTSKKK